MNPERAKHIAEIEQAKNNRIAAQVAAYEKGREEMKRRALAMLETLAQHFPKCFNLEQPQPLKIGIAEDVLAAMPGVSQTDLNIALKAYTNTPAYYRAMMVQGAERIDLNGKPVGAVKAPHAGFAKHKLRRRGQRFK
jgi:ProP effector